MIPSCPYCNLKMRSHLPVDDDDSVKPKENDISVCAECGEISIFGKNGKSLRKIDDIDKLIIDKESMQTCIAASRYIKFKKVQSN